MNVDDFIKFDTVWDKVYNKLIDNTTEKKNFLLSFVYLLNLMIWERFSNDQKVQMNKELCQYLDMSLEKFTEILHHDSEKVSSSSNIFDDDDIKSGLVLISDIIYTYPEPDGVYVEDWIASQVNLYTLEESLEALELVASGSMSLSQRMA